MNVPRSEELQIHKKINNIKPIALERSVANTTGCVHALYTQEFFSLFFFFFFFSFFRPAKFVRILTRYSYLFRPWLSSNISFKWYMVVQLIHFLSCFFFFFFFFSFNQISANHATTQMNKLLSSTFENCHFYRCTCTNVLVYRFQFCSLTAL